MPQKWQPLFEAVSIPLREFPELVMPMTTAGAMTKIKTHSPADLDRLLEGLDARRSGAGWFARCPVHEDRTPSFSINYDDARILVHCHGSCSQKAVLAELMRRGLWPGADRVAHRASRPAGPRPAPRR